MAAIKREPTPAGPISELFDRLDVVVVVPEILADRDADLRVGIGSHLHRFPSIAGREETLVVEIPIARQQRLVRAVQDSAVARCRPAARSLRPTRTASS